MRMYQHARVNGALLWKSRVCLYFLSPGEALAGTKVQRLLKVYNHHHHHHYVIGCYVTYDVI